MLKSSESPAYAPPTLTRHGSVEEITQGAAGSNTDVAVAGSPIVSDADVKAVTSEINAGEVLNRVAALPISMWTYNEAGQPTRHIGPMAQDFAAAFGVGSSDRFINTVDAVGVALAAIQALNDRLAERDRALDEIRTELRELKVELAKKS